jgi:hypothetical protein
MSTDETRRRSVGEIEGFISLLRAFAVAVLALLVPGMGALAQEERPQLKDVSSVRIANYGMPSTVIHDRAQLNAIVAELRQLRGKAWQRADTKLSCYATMVLLSGTKTVTLFRVGQEHVVERSPGKGQSTYSLVVGRDDLPKLHKLLTEIPPAKDCS